MIYGAPLPAGIVTLAANKRLARGSPGVRLKVAVDDDGAVRIYSPDIHIDVIDLKRGHQFYFDIGPRADSALDVIFYTANYVLRTEKREE